MQPESPGQHVGEVIRSRRAVAVDNSQALDIAACRVMDCLADGELVVPVAGACDEDAHQDTPLMLYAVVTDRRSAMATIA